jgi:poly(A) polymerase
MTEEFKRGADIVDKVIVGSANWSELFSKHDFFHRYRYYLQVIASTGDANLQIKWSGTVESRIRQLVMKLEYVDSLTLAHPFTKGFDQVAYCLNEDEVRAVAQGDTSEVISKRKKEDIDGVEGSSSVHSTTFYIGLAIEPKQAGAVGPRRLDISYPTTEFTKLVKMWEKFDEATMGIVVRHIKSTALPEYVFDAGERQPKQAQKRVKAPGKSSNTSPDMPNKKRRSSQSTSDVHSTAALKITENNVPSLPPLPTLPMNSSTAAPSMYPSMKGSADLKTPQLPFGENVSVATGLISAR